jgi:poly-gamma-glutamate capsule biosynthesis protein CapA/YwtB (metallophosphatase superfamily)
MHFLLSVVLAAGLSMTTLRTGVIAEEAMLDPGGTFFDDDGNIHEGAIEAIADAGITRGCQDPDLYCPDQPVTRGQMAAFLGRALNLPAATSDPFRDDDGSIFEADIAALAAAGITRGCAPESFCPEESVSRAEMAAFLTRALDLPRNDGDPFGDDDGSVFEADIAALAAAGITLGCDPPANDSFCPDDPVQRDQMASFLARALELRLRTVAPRPAVTMAFTGDVLIHMPLSSRAATYGKPYDFAPMFAPVAPIIQGVDVAICHLEVPLSSDNRNLSGYPTFNAPRQVADGLAAAGYDGCSTASNHSIDKGVAGVVSTLSVLDDAGLKQAGMASAIEEVGPALYSTEEATVAHLSATWWLNGLRLPEDKPWLVQMLEVDALLEQARAARVAGAEVVVVSMHCCTEYQVTPTDYQREVARALIASPDVDLVIGHHAHVVQPVESVDGEYIFYGLGNFLSAQRSRPATQDGVIVTVEFAARGEGWSARTPVAYPTWVEGTSYRILEAATANPASWARTDRALSLEGDAGIVVAR